MREEDRVHPAVLGQTAERSIEGRVEFAYTLVILLPMISLTCTDVSTKVADWDDLPHNAGHSNSIQRSLNIDAEAAQ